MNLRTSPLLTAPRALPSLALALTLTLPGSLPVAAAPAAASAEPARATTPCPAAQEAMTSASADRYSVAARHYEQCARSSGDPTLWKKAGMARYSARQYALAIQAMDAYLQGNPGDAQAEATLQDARKNAATVRFSVVIPANAPTPERLRVAPRGGPPGDEIEVPWARSAVSFDLWLDPGPWTAELLLPGGGRVGPQDINATRDTGSPQVVLFRIEASAAPLPSAPAETAAVDVELSLAPAAALKRGVELTWQGPGAPTPAQEVRSPTTRLSLAPGAWQLGVAAPRFVPQTRALEVRAGEPLRLQVTLQRDRLDRARIGLAAATGGVALGLLIGGVVVAARGGKRYGDAVGQLDGRPGATSEANVNAALGAIKQTSNGTMLATSAAGAGLAAITVAVDGSNRLLGAEVGVGAALVIAGVAWLVPAKRKYASDVPDDGGPWAPDRAYLNEHRRPELVAAGLIGLGAGLAAGAGAALITRTVLRRGPQHRAASVSPLPTPRAIGLALQGNF